MRRFVCRRLFLMLVWGACLAGAACALAPLTGAAAGKVNQPSLSQAAQEAGEKMVKPGTIVHLPEIVITARPIVEETRLGLLGEAVSTVGQGQLTSLAALDLPAALRRIPGVEISRYNLVGSYGGGDGGSIFLRGQGAGRPGAEISTLFDGVPRFSGVWGHPLMDVLSLDSATGIEVHKSPQPVLLGNMSFGAVNLVPLRRSLPGYETFLQASAGRYHTLSGRFRHGGRTGRFDYYMAGGREQSDGHRAHAGGRTESLYGRAGFTPAPGWDWSLQASVTRGRAEDPGSTNAPWPAADPAFQIPLFRTDTRFFLLGMPHRIGRIEGTAKIFYEYGRMDWRQWDAPAFGEPVASFRTLTLYQNQGFRLREAAPVTRHARMIAGIDGNAYGGKVRAILAGQESPAGDYLFRDYGAYLAVEGPLRPSAGPDVWQIKPSAGVRRNLGGYFGSPWGWEAALAAVKGRARLTLRQSRAFNLPGVYTAVMYEGWGRNGEWKSLRPEFLNHSEIAGAVPLGTSCDFEATLFYDREVAALRWVPPVIPPPPPFQPPRFANTGTNINRGVEAGLSARPVAGLALYGAATLMHATPTDLPNAPAWSWTVGINSRWGRCWNLSLDATGSGGQYVLDPRFAAPADYASPTARVGPRTLCNGRLGYAPRGGRSEIFLAVENLANRFYEYRPGYPMPRLTWRSGLDLGF